MCREVCVSQRTKRVLEYSSPAQEEREERRVLEKEREYWRALRMFPFGDGESLAGVILSHGAFAVAALLVLCLTPPPWHRPGVCVLAIGYVGWRWYRSFASYR